MYATIIVQYADGGSPAAIRCASEDEIELFTYADRPFHISFMIIYL